MSKALEKKHVKKRIAIYCRVSSREQAIHGYGINVQKHKIEEYIKLYDVDYESIEYFVDDGISGKSLDRPEIKRLIDLVKSKEINCIYIYKLDRLSRSVVDLYSMLNILLEVECNLVAIMDNLDISTANGRFIVGILVLISQLEREVDYERTMDAVAEMVEKGKYPYGAKPFGYDKNKDLTLRYNKRQKEVVETIFLKACDGLTIKEIENYLLYELDYHMSPDRIKEVIKKPWYRGDFFYNKKLYKNIFPPIVTEEVMNDAQQMISKRFKKYEKNKYYFSNKIRCACGKLCINQSTSKNLNGSKKMYYYYYCPDCKKRINQQMLINQSLYSIIYHDNKNKKKNNEMKMIDRLENLNKKIENLHLKYISNRIDVNTYAIMVHKIEHEKKFQMAKLKTINFVDFNKWNTWNDIERKAYVSNHIKRIEVDMLSQIIIKKELLE